MLRIGCAAAGLVLLAAADRAGLFGRAPLPDAGRYHRRSFRVVRVVDGDTLDVDAPDGRYRSTRVRLLGVDTPETVKPNTPVQHFGPEAKAFLAAAVSGRTVTLVLDPLRTRDIYGRLLAYVVLADGTNLNEKIVAEGYGYADPRFRHPLQREFKRAQKRAMLARRGLWKTVTDEDLPRYYRGRLKLPPAGAGGSGAASR